VADGGNSSVVASTVAEVDADRRRIDAALSRVCERDLEPVEHRAPRIAAAIRYSLLGGGKRFRGILLLAAYRAAGGDRDASTLAAAIEIVHAYSLVHDDLPCMDDDDVRRGQPTVHKVYGVRSATVAGLAMVPLAVRVAARAASAIHARNPERVVTELMRASGAGGMIGGQLYDLEGEGKPLMLAELEQMHRAKTGALVRAAALLGGVAAGAGEQAIDAFAQYGDALGLAFQIADDVLDVTGTTEILGKTAGRDVVLRKSTYPALLGVEGATGRAEALVHDGCAALARLDLLTPTLEQMAHFVVRRSS
jgi:geranylgeranyl pyrophosphate synthase